MLPPNPNTPIPVTTFTITQYGAVGSGTGNQTPAIQDAVNDMSARIISNSPWSN